jgi:hypothetical protein
VQISEELQEYAKRLHKQKEQLRSFVPNLTAGVGYLCRLTFKDSMKQTPELMETDLNGVQFPLMNFMALYHFDRLLKDMGFKMKIV